MSSQEVDIKIVDLITSTGVLTKEARYKSTFHECIHELSSLPISRLASEPSYLRECHKRVIEENYKWAYDNYTTFIQTAECTKKIFDDFEKVQKINENLTEKIPLLLESGNRFIVECRQMMNVANMNSLTLQKHNQILEILEIPQLLEACIRNNYLDEALELIAHSRKLERRHPNIGIITNITQEARLAAQKLLEQLFQQLGAHLQLPSCLKIVGYLRRMDCLPEPLLRLKFLQCRDNYLNGLLRVLASNDPFYHATKYMEVTRVNLFDIATQYRAVFNEEDIYMSNNDSLGQQHNMLFSSWLVMRIKIFMDSLSADINSIIDNSLSYNYSKTSAQTNSQSVGSKLQSLLGQSMYFGLSLSRIGSDFRALLLPVFYQSVMKFIDMRLLEISDSFADCIGSYKWSVNIEDWTTLSLDTGLEVAQEQLLAQKSEEITAPVKLMNHPLLALLINQVLSVLEDIRLCCPKVLRKRICHSFSETIIVIMKSLLKYFQEEGANFTNKENQSFIGMIINLLYCFLPHLDICLTMLFSSDNNSLSERIGDSIDIRGLSLIFSDLLPSSFFTVVQNYDDIKIDQDDALYDVLTEQVTQGIKHDEIMTKEIVISEVVHATDKVEEVIRRTSADERNLLIKNEVNQYLTKDIVNEVETNILTKENKDQENDTKEEENIILSDEKNLIEELSEDIIKEGTVTISGIKETYFEIDPSIRRNVEEDEELNVAIHKTVTEDVKEEVLIKELHIDEVAPSVSETLSLVTENEQKENLSSCNKDVADICD